MAKRKSVRKPAARPASKPKWEGPLGGEMFYCRLTLLTLVALFSFLALVFKPEVIPRPLMLWTLVLCAVGWLLIEMYVWKGSPEKIKQAFMVGMFLLVFDFIVENSGWIFGLWETHNSLFAIGIVPIEVMLICLIGGAAWALYLPRKFSVVHSTMDIMVFAFFGALGEHLMRQAGLMSYYQWWSFVWAVMAYALTWMVLHFVRYSWIKE